MTAFRQRLYDAYVSTHLGALRSVSKDAFERDRRVYQATLARFLPPSKEAAILDLGCGYGSFLYFLRQAGYQKAVGIDISPEQVQLAHGLGLTEAQVAEAGDYLRAHPAGFDCIVALDVLEHLAKDEVLSLLEEIRAALRPGGRLVVRTPNGDSPYASWIRYGDFTHEVIFTPTSIGQVLRASGFANIRVYPLEPVVHGPASAARWMLWRGIKQLIRLYLLVEQGVPGSGVFSANLVATAVRP